MIQINITNKRAVVQGAPVIVCGNSDYQVRFTFDDEWGGQPTKTARFKYVQHGETRYTDVPFTGDTVNIPPLTNIKEVKVGVYAGDLRTTTSARVPCVPSIRCGEGAPIEPTPNQYDQIINLLNELLVLTEAEGVAFPVEEGDNA